MTTTDNMHHLGGGTGRADCFLTCRVIERPGLDPLPYFVAGQGLQTLVIVNAYGQSVAFWELAARQLTERYRLVIVQPRGTLSATGAMQTAYPISEHVRDMIEIFDAESLGAAHLVSWHTGVKTALGFYAEKPHRVASMCFLSASALDSAALVPLHSRYETALTKLCRIVARQPELAGHVVDMLKDLLAAVPAGQGGVHCEPEGDEPDRIAQTKALALEPFRTPASVFNFAQQMIAYWSEDVSGILPRIEVPTLFIGGDADHVVTMKAVKATAALVPHALWAKVRGGTHYMQCDRYRLLADVLTEFMDKGRLFDYPGTELAFGHAVPWQGADYLPPSGTGSPPKLAAHS